VSAEGAVAVSDEGAVAVSAVDVSAEGAVAVSLLAGAHDAPRLARCQWAPGRQGFILIALMVVKQRSTFCDSTV